MSKDTKRIALFDMDGTLFDYDGRLRRDLLATCSDDEEVLVRDADLRALENIYPHMKARMELIKNQPGWWRELPLHPPGLMILRAAQQIGFDIHILTKGPSSKPRAWMEKVECIREHFEYDEVQIHITEDKSVHYGRVLVDDYPPYIRAWLEHRPRGVVIMPEWPWNKDFTHPYVIHHTGVVVGDGVRAALRAAFDRE